MTTLTSTSIYDSIVAKKNARAKQFAILVDPDSNDNAGFIAKEAQCANVDLIFIGGSILTNGNIESCIEVVKSETDIPVVLFPGNTLQINDKADGILFLSLISGRNPELLIGKHVIAAPVLKASAMEVIPTGYMLIDGGSPTAVSYMSNSTPIPSDKADIAVCTALAGEMLGLKTIYMDGGSGALSPISESMISKVSEQISVPLIIGGGIRTPEMAANACKAGADLVVVGSAVENQNGSRSLIPEISEAIHSV
ncbi:MAG TPA: geranylgeranylglyceryl/heptaprenylglyceryl phosphate synthase [Flavobacteriales bacterium]|nr:geranylgeranylglyceryl/heptaprenylglyceryl phosphate synthase [Flavobacteriales bacterium]HIA12089.1 geranylgeranylglyceryl/heptaprenylglyceryl phosphate synthase [Flavobacteriales bacterium]HIO47375.1 geranylgeranylglyceryl/heptaprenylglyceryl phosphate synthase [Candidatus Poribacteria bacterium]